jgi:hypothetical protein
VVVPVPKIPYGPQGEIRRGTLELIVWADQIATDYAARGLGLTLRQLYYQGVSQNVFPNRESSYNRLGSAVTRGRMAGLIDWNHLTDRNREAMGVGWDLMTDLPEMSDLVRGLENQVAHDLWQGQVFRPEVWVEKQALEQVAQRAAQRFRVPYLACKGYMSASEMWEAGYRRFRRYDRAGQTPVIIHIGDHDPSGIDMTRDIRERAEMFAGCYVEVRRIALNMDQIEEFNPPPNPAKTTDSRFTEYAVRFGNESWELDSLRPELLIDLIRAEIETLIDRAEWDARKAEEDEATEKVRAVADRWDEVAAWLDENPSEEE